MNDSVEAEVEVAEGLEDEVFYLREQMRILTDFLLANFMDEDGPTADIHVKNAVAVATFHLNDLKARKQRGRALTAALAQVTKSQLEPDEPIEKGEKILSRLRARLAETWERRRAETLRDALGKANDWHVTEKERENDLLR